MTTALVIWAVLALPIGMFLGACFSGPRPKRRNYGLRQPPMFRHTTEQKRRRPW